MPTLVHREPLVKTSVQLTDAQHRALGRLAAREDRKLAYLVRLAVAQYLARLGEDEEQAA